MNASKGLNCPLADGKCIYILCAKVPFFFYINKLKGIRMSCKQQS